MESITKDLIQSSFEEVVNDKLVDLGLIGSVESITVIDNSVRLDWVCIHFKYSFVMDSTSLSILAENEDALKASFEKDAYMIRAELEANYGYAHNTKGE